MIFLRVEVEVEYSVTSSFPFFSRFKELLEDLEELPLAQVSW